MYMCCKTCICTMSPHPYAKCPSLYSFYKKNTCIMISEDFCFIQREARLMIYTVLLRARGAILQRIVLLLTNATNEYCNPYYFIISFTNHQP
jgi:hypothetical protein